MIQHSKIERRALTYYISARGKRGRQIFMDDKDRLYFKNLLQQQKIKGSLNLFCYVLLPKQYSLLMETYTNTLSKSIHWINSVYANYFNRRHNLKNKLFKDHYTCLIIEKEQFLAELSCHLHLLPNKNRIAESLFQYNWSTLPGYLNRKKREDWVDYNCILGMVNRGSQIEPLTYQKYFKNIQKKQIPFPLLNLRERFVLGSENFIKEVRKSRNLNKAGNQKNDDILAKKIIELTTQSPSWSSLKVKKKKTNHTILARNAAIYFLKKYTNLSNQQISTYFKYLKKSAISQMSRRFNLKKEKYNAVNKISAFLDEKIKNYCKLSTKTNPNSITFNNQTKIDNFKDKTNEMLVTYGNDYIDDNDSID